MQRTRMQDKTDLRALAYQSRRSTGINTGTAELPTVHTTGKKIIKGDKTNGGVVDAGTQGTKTKHRNVSRLRTAGNEMTKTEVVKILEADILIYTAALHWNVARSATGNEPPRVIYVAEFIDEIAERICSSFDNTILTRRAVLHLAGWFTEHMIREQYAKLVEKKTDEQTENKL